jgi:phycocyanobilin:ferredoxin oxidoreductase
MTQSKVWDSLIYLKDNFIQTFDLYGTEVQEEGMEHFNQDGWVNRVWASPEFRRAHLDVVDARESKGLWMMHVCIFPNVGSDAPIYGFDVIAGKNKMTGAFHDFSPTVNEEHHMIQAFHEIVSELKWKRERELPDWAKAIFTEHMVAAGNVSDEEEIRQLMMVISDTLSYYVNHVGHYLGNADDMLSAKAQNRYAHYQKQNPHTPRTMKSLGLNEDDVDAFIQKCLFPEIDVREYELVTNR